jgi:geranylgeranyl diphosphate synthase type I
MDKAIGALKAIGSLGYAEERAREHAEKARKMLETIPDNEHRRCLEELIAFMVERLK